jgi:microcystin-dependent protein
MASTFSPSLRIELIGDGDQSGIWGQTTNNNLGALIEQAIAGVVTINMADTNYTMSNFNGVTDEARNQVIVLTGTNTAQRNLIAPLVEKTYVIKNSTTGGFAIQIIGSSGTGVVVPNGVTTSVYCDGLNFYAVDTGSVGNYTVNGNLAVTGTTALSGALTYGGVALSNSVTGTGSMALSASPTFTGVPLAPTATAGTNTQQIATTAFVLANGVPTGGLVMWPTGSAPSGFLLCTGAAVSRTTYAALFAIVGTTFGAGDTTTTFNLPNYTNRVPYGATVGTTGGTADAVVVSHTHTATSSVVDPGHAHTIVDGQVNTRTNPFFNWVGTGGASVGVSGANTNTNTTGITVSTTNSTEGVSGTNANLPPYLGINFIIKT